MPDTPSTDAPETGAPRATDAQPPADPAATSPTETVEFWKSKAREQEKRAKENATAAARLAEIEDAQKSETQRLSEAAEAARRDADEARAEAMRLRVASSHGITDAEAVALFLTGTDEETLTRQAQRLSEMASTTNAGAQPPAPRPDLSQGARGGNGASGDPATDFASFLQGQLSR